ncbi:hypothetical protein lerEdw1_019219 [Lerista edwardsae]|nr:hypothetical protein lerEdw1_019219 [Lerista edwardsae]
MLVSSTGFTWQDDYTQHIIARELSRLHKIRDWNPSTSSSSSSSEAPDAPRTTKQGADSYWNLGMENNMNFPKSPQQYFAYLDILSQFGAPSLHSRIKGNKASLKVDNLPSDSRINFRVQDAKGKPSVWTHSTAPFPKYTDNLPVRTFSHTQSDNFPLKPEEELDRKALLAALNAYITQKVATKNLDGSSSGSRTKESPPCANRLKPPRIDYLDGTLSKGKPGHFEMRPPFFQQPGSGSAQNNQLVPLTPVDEIFIQDVLRNLKKHHVDVDKLNLLELDEMADIIADAIQAVDAEEEKKHAVGKVEGDRAEKEVNAEGKDDYEMGLVDESYHAQDPRAQKEDASAEIEENGFSAQPRLDFLKWNLATENLPLPKESFKTEMKKSEDSDLFSSSEEMRAGVENVKSETFTRELIAAKKAEPEPKSKEMAELHHWIKNTLIQDERTYEGTREKIGEGLQLDAQSSGDEEYGYIVTETDPLSEEKGLELIKEVAGLQKLQMTTAFADIRYKLWGLVLLTSKKQQALDPFRFFILDSNLNQRKISS